MEPALVLITKNYDTYNSFQLGKANCHKSIVEAVSLCVCFIDEYFAH
jgi:hypothetical protein